jgi:hypothetical protein
MRVKPACCCQISEGVRMTELSIEPTWLPAESCCGKPSDVPTAPKGLVVGFCWYVILYAQRGLCRLPRNRRWQCPDPHWIGIRTLRHRVVAQATSPEAALVICALGIRVLAVRQLGVQNGRGDRADLARRNVCPKLLWTALMMPCVLRSLVRPSGTVTSLVESEASAMRTP